MKTGFAIIIGKVIDMVPDSFTGRDGSDVKKLSVLVKPSDEAPPIELEVWGELSEKFQADEPILQHVIVQAGVAGREWQSKNGETFRRVSLRIKEWTVMGDSVDTITKQAEQEMPF